MFACHCCALVKYFELVVSETWRAQFETFTMHLAEKTRNGSMSKGANVMVGRDERLTGWDPCKGQRRQMTL